MTRAVLAIVAALLFIGAATLFPDPDVGWTHEFWCLRCPESTGLIDVALNVVLFIPFGVALRLSGARAVVAISAIVATTLGIEALQYFVVAGRDGTIRDVLTNSVGGILGFASPPHLHHLFRPARPVAGRLAWTATALWIVHALLAIVAFRPASTPHPYHAQWAARFGGYGVFRGTILAASINGEPLPRGRFDSGLLARTRAQPDLELGATIVPGRASRRPAPIVSVSDDAGNAIAMLAQQRNGVGFRTRLVAQRIGLGAPSVHLAPSLSSGVDTTAAGPLAITASLRDWVLRARVVDATGQSREERLPLTPSLGWHLWWTPFIMPQASTIYWLTWIWLAVPMFAIGFWCARRNRGDEAPRSPGRQVAAFTPLLVAMTGAHLVIPLLLGPGMLVPLSTIAALGTGGSLGIIAAGLASPLPGPPQLRANSSAPE